MRSMCSQAGRPECSTRGSRLCTSSICVMPAYKRPTWAGPATCLQARPSHIPLPSASRTTQLLVLKQPDRWSVSDGEDLLRTCATRIKYLSPGNPHALRP